MAFEYYEFIGVPRTAVTEEINRACKLKRRALTVEGDTAGLQQLNRIQHILLDVHARQAYDETEEYGDEIRDLMADASHKMDAERWKEATRALKHLLVLAPQQAAARNLLGVCLTHLEEYDEATRVYDRLLADHPETALYWSNAAFVCFARAKELPLITADGLLESSCLHCTRVNITRPTNSSIRHRCQHCNKMYYIPATTKDYWYKRARELYREAISLEPYNPELYLMMATSYQKERRYDRALVYAERAIRADGKIDFEDFESFFFICDTYAQMRQPENMESIARRIAELARDAESRQIGAQRFTKYAADLVEYKLFETACAFLHCATIIDPDDVIARARYDELMAVVGATKEYPQLKEDKRIPDPIRRLTAFKLALANKNAMNDTETVHKEIIAQIAALRPSELAASLRQLKTAYPGAYALERTFYVSQEKRVTAGAIKL